ncbi:cytochrome c biogenesis CcdA family protein [Sporosalibacterium faouarense]|uniref:cytochrome c biogenesis CcdA family protein n=1 Tax=Sporosalibacterium faouarense TaxID=516123 RepID=UPI00192CE2AF|nr:cytochrome c biogenesis protein CcdA [Sporosalibacterium faouarense]
MEWIVDFLKQLSNIDFSIAVFISFFAGLLTGFDLCRVGMASSVLVFQNKSKKKVIFSTSLVIMISFIITFTILGIISIFLGEQIIEWFKEYENMFNNFLAIIFASMGLYMLGLRLYHILKLLPFTIVYFSFKQKKRKQRQLNHPITKAFSLGTLFAFTAIPCTTPMFLAMITYFIVKQSIFQSVVLLFIFGVGHSLPFLVIGWLAGILENTRWMARWHQILNRIIGLILIFIGIYFVFE